MSAPAKNTMDLLTPTNPAATAWTAPYLMIFIIHIHQTIRNLYVRSPQNFHFQTNVNCVNYVNEDSSYVIGFLSTLEYPSFDFSLDMSLTNSTISSTQYVCKHTRLYACQGIATR